MNLPPDQPTGNNKTASSGELLNYKIFSADSDTPDTLLKDTPPLFILHGLLGSQDNWRSQAQRLATIHTVITVDLRNHGDSPHLKGMSYRDMYEDVLKLTKHLAIEKFHLMGHSMGGKVAMKLALSHPDKVASLIIVDIAPKPYPLWHQTILGTIIKAPVSEMKSRQEINDYFADTIEDPLERNFMMKNLRRLEQGFSWKPNLDEISKNYLRIAGFTTVEEAYYGKTLFIRGEDSNYIQASDAVIIDNLFSNSKLISIKNSGHLPHFQQADEFYRIVKAFLA